MRAATVTLDVTGPGNRYLRLAATGEVCGLWPDATHVVTHRFVGRYVVADTSERRLRGTDGWISAIPRHRGSGKRRGDRHLTPFVDTDARLPGR